MAVNFNRSKAKSAVPNIGTCIHSTVSFRGILAFSKKNSQHPQHQNALDSQEDSMESSSYTAWYLLQANYSGRALELFIWYHF